MIGKKLLGENGMVFCAIFTLVNIAICIVAILSASSCSIDDSSRPLTPLRNNNNYEHLRDIYLNTTRDSLTGIILRTLERSVPYDEANDFMKKSFQQMPPINLDARDTGRDWPFFGTYPHSNK
jgi:hypothetical protein